MADPAKPADTTKPAAAPTPAPTAPTATATPAPAPAPATAPAPAPRPTAAPTAKPGEKHYRILGHVGGFNPGNTVPRSAFGTDADLDRLLGLGVIVEDIEPAT